MPSAQFVVHAIQVVLVWSFIKLTPEWRVFGIEMLTQTHSVPITTNMMMSVSQEK